MRINKNNLVNVGDAVISKISNAINNDIAIRESERTQGGSPSVAVLTQGGSPSVAVLTLKQQPNTLPPRSAWANDVSEITKYLMLYGAFVLCYLTYHPDYLNWDRFKKYIKPKGVSGADADTLKVEDITGKKRIDGDPLTSNDPMAYTNYIQYNMQKPEGLKKDIFEWREMLDKVLSYQASVLNAGDVKTYAAKLTEKYAEWDKIISDINEDIALLKKTNNYTEAQVYENTLSGKIPLFIHYKNLLQAEMTDEPETKQIEGNLNDLIDAISLDYIYI